MVVERLKTLKILLVLGALGVIGLSKRYLEPYKSPSASPYFMSPSPYLEYWTFGYRELVSDLLWLRVIQNMDQCERVLTPKEFCPHSWVYKMVDKITDLSPQFRIVYAVVPLLLALSVKDREGALELFEKGVRYFPKDWKILYRGGSLYLFEAQDKIKAAHYFIEAQKNGGPDWLVTFATRLYSEAGQRDLAQQLIKDYENSGLPPGLIQRMRDRLDEAAHSGR